MTAENYIRMLAPSFSMEWVILRFANVYGEREVRKDPGGVIQIFANQIARHRPHHPFLEQLILPGIGSMSVT